MQWVIKRLLMNAIFCEFDSRKIKWDTTTATLHASMLASMKLKFFPLNRVMSHLYLQNMEQLELSTHWVLPIQWWALPGSTHLVKTYQSWYTYRHCRDETGVISFQAITGTQFACVLFLYDHNMSSHGIICKQVSWVCILACRMFVFIVTQLCKIPQEVSMFLKWCVFKM